MKKIVLSLILGLPLVLVVLIFTQPVQTGQWVYDASMSTEAGIYGFSEQTIPIGDMALSVYRNSEHLGSDKPSILMLHGYSAEKTVWLRFARHLTDSYNIIIPDMAGHGKTGFSPDWDYTGPAQAARLLALLDRLQIQRVHVIGNSMGGFIAAHFARLYPERTLTATLVDPAGVASPEPSVMDQMLAKGENPFQVSSDADFKRFYGMTMAQPPFVPDFVKAGVSARYQSRREELKRIFEDFHGKDRLDTYLSAISVPVLIMWGGKDELIHVSSAQVWQKGLSNSEVKIWPEIGHMPMVEIPAESASVYRDFLKRNP
jgi:pimeloyl-ACP methyl ester carboxylesterase